MCCLYLSATRIMRRRFLPSSLGLMLLGCGGKKMAQAARTLRTKSVTGPFALDCLCLGLPPCRPSPMTQHRGIDMHMKASTKLCAQRSGVTGPGCSC